MKKTRIRIVVMMAVLMIVFTWTAKAQIFIADDDFEGSMRRVETEWVLVAPQQGGDSDAYTPIGEGGWLLGGFVAAYLLKRRKKEKKGERVDD